MSKPDRKRRMTAKSPNLRDIEKSHLHRMVRRSRHKRSNPVGDRSRRNRGLAAKAPETQTDGNVVADHCRHWSGHLACVDRMVWLKANLCGQLLFVHSGHLADIHTLHNSHYTIDMMARSGSPGTASGTQHASIRSGNLIRETRVPWPRRGGSTPLADGIDDPCCKAEEPLIGRLGNDLIRGGWCVFQCHRSFDPHQGRH